MPSESLLMCPAMITWMRCLSASSRSSWPMCMPTIVPTPVSASFSMTFFGPSVPPVMSTQTLPARLLGVLSPMYGPAPFCAAMRYSGISSSALLHVFDSSGFFLAKNLFR